MANSAKQGGGGGRGGGYVSLTALSGTPNQVARATDIRADIIDRAESYRDRVLKAMRGGGEVDGFDIEKSSATEIRQARKWYNDVIRKSTSRNMAQSARFWIGKRSFRNSNGLNITSSMSTGAL